MLRRSEHITDALAITYINHVRQLLLVAELTVGHILWPATHVTHQSADP